MEKAIEKAMLAISIAINLYLWASAIISGIAGLESLGPLGMGIVLAVVMYFAVAKGEIDGKKANEGLGTLRFANTFIIIAITAVFLLINVLSGMFSADAEFFSKIGEISQMGIGVLISPMIIGISIGLLKKEIDSEKKQKEHLNTIKTLKTT